jgi:hypothetical protein
MAPRARLELATLRLTAVRAKNLSAPSGVAYREFGAILTPNPASSSRRPVVKIAIRPGAVSQDLPVPERFARISDAPRTTLGMRIPRELPLRTSLTFIPSPKVYPGSTEIAVKAEKFARADTSGCIYSNCRGRPQQADSDWK